MTDYAFLAAGDVLRDGTYAQIVEVTHLEATIDDCGEVFVIRREARPDGISVSKPGMATARLVPWPRHPDPASLEEETAAIIATRNACDLATNTNDIVTLPGDVARRVLTLAATALGNELATI